MMYNPLLKDVSADGNGRKRLAILGSHPVPYWAALYRALHAKGDLDIRVFFGDRYGVEARDSAWGIKSFRWSNDVVEGYPHEFLTNLHPKPNPTSFAGKINPALVPRLLQFRPHVTLVHGYASIYCLQGIASSRASHSALLLLGDTNRVKDTWDRKRKNLRAVALKMLYKQFSGFLSIGESNREHYEQHGVSAEKIYRFPFAVDNEKFRSQSFALSTQRRELRRKWSIPEEAFCFVTAGRLAPEKNIGELIEGIAKVDSAFLLVVGGGEQRSALERKAKEKIPGRHHFAGFLGQDELGQAYAAADAFALTSSIEPWGLVCNEAMNFGLPLVLSDQVGAGADLVDPGKTGWVYPIGDVEKLTESLGEAMQSTRQDRDHVRQLVLAKVSTQSIDGQVAGVLDAVSAVRR